MPELLTPGLKFLEREVGPAPAQLAGSGAAAFIGTAEKGPVGEATFVSSYGDFVREFGNDHSLGYLATGVERFFEMGGQRAWIVRTAHYDTPEDPSSHTADKAIMTIVDNSDTTPADMMDVEATTPGTWANDYQVAIENVDDTSSEFDLKVLDAGGDVVESYYDLVLDSSDENYFVETVINDGVRTPSSRSVAPSENIRVSVLDETVTPASGTTSFGEGTNGQEGSNGVSSISDSDFVGDSSAESGLYALNTVPEMLNIVVPGETSETIFNAAINYAKTNPNRGGPYGWDFYVADVPMGLDPQGAMEKVRDTYNTNSWEGVFYPWVVRGGDIEPVAPYIAGLMAQVDQQYGPWRAPAGTDWKLPVDEPNYDVSETDQQILNPHGVNAIRELNFEGVVNWGARTGDTGSKWQYISTRRFFNFIKKSLDANLQWTIFEQNGPKLWQRVEDTLDSFMSEVWSLGAFGGYSKEESYFVQCDEELNPPESVESGILRSRVGINPTEPAEFHIITLENHTSGATMPNNQ